ncbi:hypothetical protein [Hyphomonas pacifica]|uniref:hypothetical protein n=1 Tax=Hyphomonas pacifica TaxID=1280941 RepID=UPI000DC04E61|nr:hypothetical protein [Hyphomonas pacifica]RAN33312.1 hypothetical protein HY11_16825 [Hyphomonas pacifica]
MSLKPLIWNGNHYTLAIRRHWNTFFGLATVFEITAPRTEKLLPVGAGVHISGLFQLCERAREYFDTFDNWWAYSRRLCDQYCEFYIMKRPAEDNVFARYHSLYINDRYAVQNSAKSSRGYVGPDAWTLT